jgi:hypothetical protein
MKKNKIRAEIIVDMYEIRASVAPPSSLGKLSKKIVLSDDLRQYNFMSTIIAHLCDKYKINDQDIDNVMRERSLQRLISK